MLLQRLKEYGERMNAPPLYEMLPLRYIIRLNEIGEFQGMVDLATKEEKRGALHLLPDCVRSSGIHPKIGADTAEYVLGIVKEPGKEDRAKACHDAFVAENHRAAVSLNSTEFQAIDRFLQAYDHDLIQLNIDLEAGDNVTFDIHGKYITDLPSVQQYWGTVGFSVEDTKGALQCLICGENKPAVPIAPVPIKGIPDGQSTGMALISANSAAFESYGLENSRIAPVCKECSVFYGQALNALLKSEKNRVVLRPLVYLFWTRSHIDFDLCAMFSNPSEEDVKALMNAPYRGAAMATEIESQEFYSVVLSASGARIVVRDWVETSIESARYYLQRYFRLQQIVDWNGKMHWFSLKKLLRATVNSKSKVETASGAVGQSLLHVALKGGKLPDSILYQVVRRLRAEPLQIEHVALIKMVLLSGENERNLDTMAELDTDRNDPAYVCGRLLAILESLQCSALGKVNATIVDRFYGTASSAPASVFSRLMRGAQTHLSTIRKDTPGLAVNLEKRLQAILGKLTDFPAILTLQEQGMFALGYYHQREFGTNNKPDRSSLVGEPSESTNK